MVMGVTISSAAVFAGLSFYLSLFYCSTHRVPCCFFVFVIGPIFGVCALD